MEETIGDVLTRFLVPNWPDSYESLATSLELRAYKATQVVIELAASVGINVHHVSGWVGQGDVRYITPRS